MEDVGYMDECLHIGTWEKLNTRPLPGDVVRVVRNFMSGDERSILLRAGDVGIVHDLDADGDACVRFPRLSAVVNKNRWVLKSRFENLLKHC